MTNLNTVTLVFYLIGAMCMGTWIGLYIVTKTSIVLLPENHRFYMQVSAVGTVLSFGMGLMYHLFL